MPTFQFQLTGFPIANRDAEVQMVHEATGKSITRKPFLDGSLLVRDLDAGFYQIKVVHPNLINPIDQRRVRLFPQKPPTVVHIPVPEDLFKDTPIRDRPDADLTPVQQMASGARDQLKPLGNKIPGEVIKSAEWNMVVEAVVDLSNAVLELTQLVSPTGHDHPEIAEKIAEVQGNILRFSEAFARSLLELQREIETENLRQKVGEVLDLGEAPQEVRDRLTKRLNDLGKNIQGDTIIFTRQLSTLSAAVMNEINNIAAAKGDQADDFLNNPVVKETVSVTNKFFTSGTQSTADQEFNVYRQTTSLSGGAKLTKIIGG